MSGNDFKLDSASVIGVVGAGAMGAGIAQIAAMRGHRVIIADALPASITRARDGHQKAMAREVEKGRLQPDIAGETLSRFTYVDGVSGDEVQAFAECDFVIEAIIENLSEKQALCRVLESVVHENAVLASNTSSLSIAAIAGACKHTRRVVGVHFFNPATLMPLVEIIPAITTSAEVAKQSRALMDAWGQGHGDGGRHARLHRESRCAAVLQRIAPYVGRRARRRTNDRLGHERIWRVSHGSVRTDGPYRQRRQLCGDEFCV